MYVQGLNIFGYWVKVTQPDERLKRVMFQNWIYQYHLSATRHIDTNDLTIVLQIRGGSERVAVSVVISHSLVNDFDQTLVSGYLNELLIDGLVKLT